MRYLIAATLALSTVGLTRTAHATHDLHALACDYHASVHGLVDHMQHDPYASRYVAMYVGRLEQTACELHEAIERDPNCPRVLALFEETCALHNRVDRLLSTSCRRQSHAAQVWQETAAIMEQLHCAFNPQPVVARRVTISGLAPQVVTPLPQVYDSRSRRNFSLDLRFGSQPPVVRPRTYVAPVTPPVVQDRGRSSDRTSSPYRLDRQRTQYREIDHRGLNSRNQPSRSASIVAGVLSGLFQ